MTEHTKPVRNIDQLRSQLQRYDRTPFVDALAKFLSGCPDEEEISAFAKKHPDKWAAATKQLGLLSGFSERRELTIDAAPLHELSDSQLEARILQQARKLGIDAEFEDLTKAAQAAEPATLPSDKVGSEPGASEATATPETAKPLPSASGAEPEPD